MNATTATEGVRSRRVRWSLLLLFVSIATSAAALWNAGQALRSNKRVAQRLLFDYSGFAAWSFQHHAEEALKSAAQQMLGPYAQASHGYIDGMRMHQGPIPRVQMMPLQLAQTLRKCQCSAITRVQTFFAFTLGSDTIGTEGARLAPAVLAMIQDSVTREARALSNTREWDFRWVFTGTQEAPIWLAYTLMPRTSGDTIVYGFLPHAVSVRALLDRTFAHDTLLPPTLAGGRRNADIMQVAVLHPHSDRVIYLPESMPRGSVFADSRLAPEYGGLLARAVIRPQMASSLIIGGLPASGLPFLGGLLLLSLALGLVAVLQLRREDELAAMRSDFVASVSHELRTPLAQIRLFVDTLRLGRAGDRSRFEWALSNIERETLRLSALVENVLHFSRRGRSLQPALRRLNVGEEAEAVIASFLPLAKSRDARVELSAAPDVFADLESGAFRQLLLNLLENAVKYGPAGQTIRVSVGRDGSSARVSVTDKGPGIPANERDSIWKPFFRGTTPRVSVVGGSGIGLSIVRDIAQAHRGRVWVEDAPDGGASFVFELPLAQREELAGRSAAS